MRAKLSATGMITLAPENEVESYALMKWAEDYFRAPGGEGNGNQKASLLIETVVDRPDAAGERSE